ncbi:PfkB family carbohydrate kinase [Thermogemmatispora sp.]|uniref:PfkB family carbohydrate kinase n=1 Tax=Thermogemmatispora sp. TaxID=1968838 RepID=UPI0035E45C36
MSELRLRPKRLVLVGSVLVDLLLYVERLPERGGDLLAQRSLQAVGGGFNVLLGAWRLGLPAAYAGRIGDGPMGSLVRAELEAAGIPGLLPPVRGRDTGFDIGLVEPDGERTFVTAPGVEAELSLEELAPLALQEGDAVYVSGYDLCYPVSGAALEAWLPQLPSGCLLVLDPGPLVASISAARLERVLSRVDVLSLNARELRLLSGEEEPARGAAQLRERLAPQGIVVARVGAEGCWLATGEGEAPRHVVARPARVVVDTTGAGDAHVAAFLAALAAGKCLSEAAYEANVAASLAVERAGPATTPTRAELQAALKEEVNLRGEWE